MKVIRYVDVYPGMTAESVYLYNEENICDLYKGHKRYRIEFELPDNPLPVDGVIGGYDDITIKEVE